MGQAFRRASGKIRVPDRKPPPPTTSDKLNVTKTATHFNTQDTLDKPEDSDPKINTENVLEERDPRFDAMLSQMVGRISSKPGGTPEMGEASVVERYNRPMPKLRNTRPDSGRYEERPAPPGTLNVAQLRRIIQLHQGKADDYNGSMDVHQIAKTFRLEVAQVQKILQFVSLPPEDSKKKKDFQ